MSDEPSDADSAPSSQRLDKWLWFARFAKTRTLAATLIAGGKVRVNRERVIKPAQTVRVGDVLTIVITRHVQLVRVKGFAERRGPSAAARLLYEELTVEGDAIKPQSAAPPDGEVRPAIEVAPVQRPAGSGRPTKKERREIDKFHGKSR
ncbi:RNA-binding S4 domain-containing protein [Hyphomicrobium sulfonivorans]|uniref:RNA-binding S4 domain-containing protein n=1 Tax=Hyphomicrobium sulfonivorans TaxID=121290 RepID=UPI00157000A2|nr:RNA-binding S4 domain-containing protein [Hyphomicrobium sulfonivorans]MBI1648647.1 RNA-binding S4 domain-containing protein [Hyphomicrobium sulfonivorans]NSL70817.1 RNA-binding protein [Hyphomicrobium sulfonivorans]